MFKNSVLNVFLMGVLVGLAGCAGTPPKLGLDQGQLTPCGSKPNCVGSQNSDEEHAIDPIVIEQPRIAVAGELVSLLNNLDRVRVTGSDDHYVRAECSSWLFGFVDDVEFLMIEESPNKTVIHVRSGSRVGYSDLGVNRERIEKIRMKLTQSAFGG